MRLATSYIMVAHSGCDYVENEGRRQPSNALLHAGSVAVCSALSSSD